MHPQWQSHLQPWLDGPEGKALRSFLAHELRAKKTIYPPMPLVFHALELTSLSDTRVVILGQDPYHGPGQAHGLSFSVPCDQAWPPSLRNIFQELHTYYPLERKPHGDLSSWAKQGVLLLNTILTVEHKKPASHHKQGWEQFTLKVIQLLSERKEPLVFCLWGAHAQSYKKWIAPHHFCIESAHPSPLSAYRGFFGSNPFGKINSFLKKQKKPPIDWRDLAYTDHLFRMA